MAKLSRVSCIWKYVMLGQPVGTWKKMHGDRKLRCNFCKHLWQGNQSKAARHFCKLKKCLVAQLDVLVDIWNSTNYKFDDRYHTSIRAYMEEHGIRDSRVVAGGARSSASPSTAGRDEMQDVLDEMEEHEGVMLPGEEVVMTSRGEDPARQQGKRPMGEADQAATRPGKRVHQSKIDEVYDADKQSVFKDKFLTQSRRKATDEIPRGVRMRFSPFKEIGGDRVPSQRAKVAALLREVRESFCHSGATILSDGRKLRDSRPIVNFLIAGANGALLYANICRDRSVPDMGAIVFRRWRTIIESFPTKDVIAFCTDSASNYTATARLFAADPDLVVRRITWLPCSTHVCNLMLLDIGTRVGWAVDTIICARAMLLRRMDRGGMMMSIVYEWSRHLVQLLMKMDDVPADLLTPCVREVRMRLMHLLEPAHAAAHLLNPRRRSLRYYESLHTMTEDAEVVHECDHFLLAQTAGDPTCRDYLLVRYQLRRFHARRGNWGDQLVSDAEADDCQGDQETHHCAAWWFAHGTAHPELRAIAVHVMHMWTSASSAERNWAAHERIPTAKWSKLCFAKMAQLVEIKTNLKLASCRQQDGGYVLLWVMDGVDTERRRQDEDEDGGNPESDVWGARPVGTFSDREVRRQIEVFRKDGTNRPREVSAVFGDRAATLLPFDHVPPPSPPPSRGVGEGSAAVDEDGEDDWTDAEDVVGGTDRTAEQVYFPYGGGSDGHAPRTSVITDNVAGGAQGRATRRPQAGRGRGAVARDVPPRARRVLGVDSSGDDEGEADDADRLRNPRFDPSHHSREQSEHLHRSQRLAECSEWVTEMSTGRLSYEERDTRLDREEEARLQFMPRWDGREAYEAEGVRDDRSGFTIERRTIADFRHDATPFPCWEYGGIHGGEEEMVDEGIVPLDDDAAQVEEEGAAVHAGHSAPSVRDGETGGHVEEEGAAVDMSLVIIVRPPLVPDVDTGGHVHSGAPVSFYAGGYSREMPQWDGGEPGDCTRTPFRPEQLERLGTEDPFPFTGGQPSHPAWAPTSPRRVMDSLRRDYDREQGLFVRGPSGEEEPAAGACEAGRPSVHTAGRILGLDRVATRRTERMVPHPARSTMEDGRQGVPYTSGEDDMHMPQGSRRYGSLIDLDSQIGTEEQRLAELIRERERRSETEAAGPRKYRSWFA
ncbi:hypothetical protein CBR_g37842 [Chara braunii]|uniref:DUF659 domain-containing protein n=1 Tax=Chara braunii TaxID=69332 RepID=A0A388LNP4_CHABU|nr:hypothetical protein CBR_g37842 [Chara braunii]|eukprot:GBG83970.1 hypothetical protein CBR_g37842 [Chara braunii]